MEGKVSGKGAVWVSSIAYPKSRGGQIKGDSKCDQGQRKEIRLEQGVWPSHYSFMTQSTVTDKFQTTIPLAVRRALKLAPRQRVSYELRADGSAILRPVPQLDALFGCMKPKRRVASIREEKAAARLAMARDAAGEGLK